MNKAEQTISIPLARWVNALIGIKQYAIIDVSDATAIQLIDGWNTVCEIENTDNLYSDMYGQKLPQLDNGLARLWLRSTFEQAENGRRKRIAERESLERYDENLRRAVATIMSKQLGEMITVEVCYQTLANASRRDMENTLTANAQPLPQKD